MGRPSRAARRGKSSNPTNLKSHALEHEHRKEFRIVQSECGVPFVDPLVEKLGLLAGAVDAAEVPAGLEAGGDDAGGDVAVVEELVGGGDEEAVEEKRR